MKVVWTVSSLLNLQCLLVTELGVWSRQKLSDQAGFEPEYPNVAYQSPTENRSQNHDSMLLIGTIVSVYKLNLGTVEACGPHNLLRAYRLENFSKSLAETSCMQNRLFGSVLRPVMNVLSASRPLPLSDWVKGERWADVESLTHYLVVELRARASLRLMTILQLFANQDQTS